MYVTRLLLKPKHSNLRTQVRTLATTTASSISSPDSDPPVALTSKQKARSVLSLLKKESNPQKIIDICKAASLNPNSQLDRIALKVAVSKLVELNCLECIRVFIEELKLRPDLRNERFASHSIILYGEAGMIQNAITTFEQMDKLDVQRTVKSLNALLLACILAKKYDEVERIFTEFPKMYNIKPNIDTYNTAIKAFCQSKQSSLGYSIVAEMDINRCKPNATTFGNLIAGFYREEKFDDVGKVLKLMEEHGMKPGLSTYNIRIESLCKLGRSFEAKALLDVMIARGVNPDENTYCSLIHGFCKEGKLEDAKRLFKNMVNYGCKPNSNCYFIMVYFLCKGGDYETALEITKQSLEINWVPNFTTMKTLVEGLASISKVDEAKEVVSLIKKKFPNTAYLWEETEREIASIETYCSRRKLGINCQSQ